MRTFAEKRRAAIVARFRDRTQLDKQSLWRQYFAEFDQDEVITALKMIEEELVVPVGVLRPGDNLVAIISPVTTWNPVHWL